MTNGKQRVRVIIEQLVKENGAELMQDRLTHPSIDQALDSIEEIVKEVLGEKQPFVESPDQPILALGALHQNKLLLKQWGRWESK